MNKKTYQIPQMDVIELKQQTLLAGSLQTNLEGLYWGEVSATDDEAD
jgi:hypothetical protein